MRRLLPALLAAVLLLAAAAPGARGQGAEPPERPRSGPDALWDAYPLDQRPRDADGAGEAGVAPSPGATGNRVAFVRREPGSSPALTVAAALCLAAGVLLCGAGLLAARRDRRRSRYGRGRSGLPAAWR